MTCLVVFEDVTVRPCYHRYSSSDKSKLTVLLASKAGLQDPDSSASHVILIKLNVPAAR